MAWLLAGVLVIIAAGLFMAWRYDKKHPGHGPIDAKRGLDKYKDPGDPRAFRFEGGDPVTMVGGKYTDSLGRVHDFDAMADVPKADPSRSRHR